MQPQESEKEAFIRRSVFYGLDLLVAYALLPLAFLCLHRLYLGRFGSCLVFSAIFWVGGLLSASQASWISFEISMSLLNLALMWIALDALSMPLLVLQRHPALRAELKRRFSRAEAPPPALRPEE